MGHRSSRSHDGRFNLIAWFALLALAFKALVPAGYMVDVSPETGGLTITLCSGAGNTRTVVLDLATGTTTELPDGHDGHDDGAQDPCPYAAAAKFVSLKPPAGDHVVVRLPNRAAPVVTPDHGPIPTSLVTGSPIGSRAPPRLSL